MPQIPLDLTDDNPYNPRTYYAKDKTDELAHSIKTIGILEVPTARQVDGRYQLAFGHRRKRAYEKLAKTDKKYAEMPLNIAKLTDEQMFYYAMEENIKRGDLKPIEVARGIDAFLKANPKVTEQEVGEELGLAQASVSNMRRVLTLPDLILEKIDKEIINFTMGRELLVFADLEDARNLMSETIKNLNFENKSGGFPCTVEGIQKSIDRVARDRLKPIKGGYSYSKPDFDTKDCEKCERLLVTHPEKSTTGSYCKDSKCWEKNRRPTARRSPRPLSRR